MPQALILCALAGFTWSGYAQEMNTLIPTVYYTAKVQDKGESSGCRKRSVTDTKGRVLARLCEQDYCKCTMEGSCVVDSNDGSFGINTVSKKGSGKCPEMSFAKFDTSTCKYGYGNSRKSGKKPCLIPYKTMACPESMPAGTVIHIPRAVGKKYRVDGSGPEYTHDGNFICMDTGDRIKNNKGDVFVGLEGTHDKSQVITSLKLDDPRTRIQYSIVDGKLPEDKALIQNLTELSYTYGQDQKVTRLAEHSGFAAGTR